MTRPLLQFAIDSTCLEDALRLAEFALEANVDIIEVGTPLITQCGLCAISRFVSEYPHVPICADLKTIDFADMEVQAALRCGAAIVSVMVFANDAIIRESLDLGRQSDGVICFSTMGFPLSLLCHRVHQIRSLGGTRVIAHGSGVDQAAAFRDLTERASALATVSGIELVVGGGINAVNLPQVLRFGPHTVIVGRSIRECADPGNAIRELKAIIDCQHGG